MVIAALAAVCAAVTLLHAPPPSAAAFTSALGAAVQADVAASAYDPAVGQDVWVFGDTTAVNGVATCCAYGYPHSSMATQQPGQAAFTMRPAPFGYGWQIVPDWPDGTFFWAAGIVTAGAVLYVPGERVRVTGSSFAVTGGYVAQFSATTLAFIRVTALRVPGHLLTLWSSPVPAPGGGWAVAGADPGGQGIIARIPPGALAAGRRWQLAGIIPASLDTGSGIVLYHRAGAWSAWTKRGDAYDGSTVEELTAPALAGPWALHRQWPATTPAPGEVTYGAGVHPGPGPAGWLLISWDVGGGPAADYHPRFLYVRP